MRVRLRLFSTYREVAGRKDLDLELPEGARLRDVLEQLWQEHPRLRQFEPSMLLAVNQEFADPETTLKAGDEVAVMPPVSGGAGSFVRLQDGAIDPAEVLASVRDVAAGASVLFLGSTRNDGGVEALDYEVYDAMAVKKLTELRDAAVRRFRLTAMTVVHRRGRVPLGEDAVAVAASSPHRAEAFAAAAWAMDEVKRIVPLWKSER